MHIPPLFFFLIIKVSSVLHCVSLNFLHFRINIHSPHDVQLASHWLKLAPLGVSRKQDSIGDTPVLRGCFSNVKINEELIINNHFVSSFNQSTNQQDLSSSLSDICGGLVVVCMTSFTSMLGVTSYVRLLNCYTVLQQGTRTPQVFIVKFFFFII